ncbi:MAG: hypothetical protein OHK0029_36060 [Armatimonadaceae bacterium]
MNSKEFGSGRSPEQTGDSAENTIPWHQETLASNPTGVSLLTLLGVTLVGLLDYLTGLEIRVYPLYLFPIMLASWYLGRWYGGGTALLATIVWFISYRASGGRYSREYIWVVNFITQGGVFFSVAFLVCTLREALRREQVFSRTDYLTGLANVGGFYRAAENTLRMCQAQKQSVALAYIDLDNFKTVNDTGGHEQGDTLIRRFSEILHANFPSGSIIARLGGDEFAVLIPGILSEDIKHTLENVRDTIVQHTEFQPFSVTVSIGAVVTTSAPPDLQTLLAAADGLMYEVKRGGKNEVRVRLLESGGTPIPVQQDPPIPPSSVPADA